MKKQVQQQKTILSNIRKKQLFFVKEWAKLVSTAPGCMQILLIFE
jgi:hypothetical protein